MSNPTLPISQKNLNRIMVLLIIVLALAAGFFQAVAELEKRKAEKVLHDCQAASIDCPINTSDASNPAQVKEVSLE